MLDAELAALVWLLVGGGVPVHVAGDDPAAARELAASIVPLARQAAVVSFGSGYELESVLRQPLPLRPATGAVLILAGGRVAAAHFLRPPLRDSGGHVRSQPPAVLAAWDERDRSWEHFAWGIWPDLAAALGRPAGDAEIDHGRRRERLDALAAATIEDGPALERALHAHVVGGGFGDVGRA